MLATILRQIVTTEPTSASLLAGKEFNPHKIQGWTPNFVPGIISSESNKPWDDIVPVTDDEAIEGARALARKEGIFCGISAGGTFAAALKVGWSDTAAMWLLCLEGG